MLDRIGPDRPLGVLGNRDLREFGKSLDQRFYPGLPGLFDDLRKLVTEFRDISIEFCIVSGGLQEVIGGSDIVNRWFDGFYGCQLGDDGNGVLHYVKRCVTFTEKTRYLFEINKGVRPADSRTKPHLVNDKVAIRRVPFRHMIHVGDGLTDIPCFSLVRKEGGRTFGVFSRDRKSAKQAFLELLQERRVDSLHSPDYRESANLGALIRAAVSALAAVIDLDAEQAR